MVNNPLEADRKQHFYSIYLDYLENKAVDFTTDLNKKKTYAEYYQKISKSYAEQATDLNSELEVIDKNITEKKQKIENLKNSVAENYTQLEGLNKISRSDLVEKIKGVDGFNNSVIEQSFDILKSGYESKMEEQQTQIKIEEKALKDLQKNAKKITEKIKEDIPLSLNGKLEKKAEKIISKKVKV